MSVPFEDAFRAARAEVDTDAKSLRARAEGIAEYARAEDAAIESSTTAVKAKVATVKAKLATIEAELVYGGDNNALKAELIVSVADLSIIDAKAAAFEAYTQAFTIYRASYEKEMKSLSELCEAFMVNATSGNIKEAVRLFNTSREQKTKVVQMGEYMVALLDKLENTVFDVVGKAPA